MYNLYFVPTPCAPVGYPLSLHDALPIFRPGPDHVGDIGGVLLAAQEMIGARKRDEALRVLGRDEDVGGVVDADRKSTRLNSSHVAISYAVFCLKKKNRAAERHT